jgi:hypothetical protein
MALRRLLGCLPVAALAICALTACKDKEDVAKNKATAAELDERCALLGKACGDKDKHVEKIIEACKQDAKKHVDKGCTDKAIAVHDCYVKDLCGGPDKVWTLDDLNVLADRHGKCVAERKAARECVEKK